MKKIMAGFLAISFLFATNCGITRNYNLDVSKAGGIYRFIVKAMDDSEKLYQNETAVLLLSVNFIQFIISGKNIIIPYNKIISMHSNSKQKQTLNNISNLPGHLYWRQNPYLGGYYILGAILFALLIPELISLLMKIDLFQKNISIFIYYKDDNNDKWISFSLPEKKFVTLRMLLKQRTGLEFQN